MEPSEKPTLLHTGIRKFAMKDPDGYEVEFVEPPAEPIAAQPEEHAEPAVHRH